MSIKDGESSFNHEIVWPAINVAVKSAATPIAFRLREILLDASDEDFKADAIAEAEGMEMPLLETSGPYGIKDNSRFGRDHVKGAFEVLTFLRKILKTWYLATEDIMRQLKVIFVHARGAKIHLWTLEIPSKDVQVLKHVIGQHYMHQEIG